MWMCVALPRHVAHIPCCLCLQGGASGVAVLRLFHVVFAAQSNNQVFGRTNNPYDLSRCAVSNLLLLITQGAARLEEAPVVKLRLSARVVRLWACHPMLVRLFLLALACNSFPSPGGSIRMPAFFCGLFGHKPTGGVTPETGQWPPSTRGIQRFDSSCLSWRSNMLISLLLRSQQPVPIWSDGAICGRSVAIPQCARWQRWFVLYSAETDELGECEAFAAA